MTVLESIRLACPICDARVDSKQVVSTNALGGKRTDFHERASGMQPLAYRVHMCPTCGYAGTTEEFGATNWDPMFRQRVWNELAPMVVESTTNGSTKYEAAAKIAVWQSADPRSIAQLWLNAAWCCKDEDDVEAERYFRRLAAWKFEEALSSYDGMPPDDRAVITYLVGEIWRRVGDDKLARAWFDRVAGEVTDGVSQKWVLDVAVQQSNSPHEWFG